MRPSSLNPLFKPVGSLPGLGPRLAPLVERLSGPHVVDLLWHRPSGVIDRRFTPMVADAPGGQVATLTVMIEAHTPPDSPRRPTRVRCSDETGFITLVFFHGREDWLRRTLPVGEVRVVSGLVDRFNGEAQIVHPDHIVTLDQRDTIAVVEPVYPLTAGISAKQIGKWVHAALAQAPDLPEWQDPAWKSRQNWPGWRDALTALHNPQADSTAARRRLAYDELLANQLALAMMRRHMRQAKGRVFHGDGRLRAKVLNALPFSLTGAQTRSLAEIDADMASPLRMLRLLQGDVGSGKTVVALLAMLTAVESGAQAALMAPTEILARQHHSTIEPLAASAGVRVALLTGRDKGKARDAVLSRVVNGEVDILLGTHALFQADVVFRDLGLAVIDEQHRFGVHQRLELTNKGRAVDVLAMTATPIPRTLLLTAYGDMDSSRLDEKPPGRKPVDTRVLPLTRLDEVVGAVRRAVQGGARAFWVCPLVEESETSDLAAAEQRHQDLSELFGNRAGLIHGRMKGPARDAVMAAFGAGELDLLVATTVIEVGVDVPQATVMVIEHAERFGLAQLHQLRGRIGRGERASTCLLLYGSPLSETAKARLEVMRASEDGFLIAEEDLRLRGGGEMLGTRQSGLPGFKLADPAEDGDLLAVAKDDAKLILERDPELAGERGGNLRTLLYLFERDQAVLTLRSG